jgi:hypothetical protein
MLINNAVITGSFIVNGTDVAGITGSSAISSSYLVTSASYAVTSASYAQSSASLSIRTGNLEATSSTLTSASSSFAAQSASLSTRLTTDEANIATNTAASASFAAQSSSLSTRLTTDETNFTNLSSSFATTSGSLSTRVTNLEVTSSVVSSSFATTSGSISSRVTIIEGQDATTGSNIFTGPQYVNQASNAISFTSTASLYTDGGLRVSKDSFVSGTAYFNNVVVYGTSSIQYITSSQVNFGTNIITVNTDTPAVRFGGLAVFDSGSTQLTGSMLWDSEKNHWIYSNPSGSTYNSAMLMNGPRNTGSLGTEQGTTACALMMGQGGDHITSSMIYSYGNATCFYGQSYISSSGAACFAGTITGSSATFSGNLILNTGSTNGLILQNSAGGESPNVTFLTPVNKYNIDANAIGTLRFFTENTDGSGGVVRVSLDCAGAATFASTIAGTTIYGSTAVCSPVGKFTTCLDLGGALSGTSAVFSSSVQVGAGTYSSGLAKLYTDSTYGTILTGKSGSSSDMLLTDRSGNIALQIVANSATPNVVIGNNLGLGVTPSVWSLGKAIEIGNLGHAIWSVNATQYNIMYNAYYNGGFVYASSNPASYYQQASGAHTWYNAPSGTAGCALTFTSAMTLNTSGNLGLGVTPSAWALYKAIQVQGASIANFDTSDNSIVGSNVFYGGSPTDFRYISTGTSTMYRLNGGVHSWYTAPSGTAGCAISFTQAMTLDCVGKLGICTTAPSTRLALNSYVGARLPYVNGTGNTYDANGITVGNLNNGNTNIGGGLDMTNNCYCIGAYSPILSFSSVSSNYTYNNSYAGIWGVFQGAGGDANWNKGDLAFGTAVDYGIFERMRITNAGNVYIGATTGAYPTYGYMLGVRAPSGTQTYMSITAPGQSLDDQGLVIGVDSSSASFYMRDAKDMTFFTCNTERMRIKSTGIATFACQVCATSGVKFGNGSSTLNYYDEAISFTPCLYFQGAVTGLSYATRYGYYTKIGNTVLATMYIQWCKSSSATDNIGVYLPVTSMNNGTPAIGNFYSGGSISETRPIQVYVGANSTISLLLTQDGGGNLANCFANSTLHYWMVTMQYMT